jgi:hypothetical protein
MPAGSLAPNYRLDSAPLPEEPSQQPNVYRLDRTLYESANSSVVADYFQERLDFGQEEPQGQVTQTAHGDDVGDPTREEIKLQGDAIEARTDTKVVRLEGKLDTIAATITGKIDALSHELDRSRDETRDSRLILMATIIGAALAIGGLIVTMALYGDALFGRGMNVRDVVQAVVKETQEQQRKEQVIPRFQPTPPNTQQ